MLLVLAVFVALAAPLMAKSVPTRTLTLPQCHIEFNYPVNRTVEVSGCTVDVKARNTRRSIIEHGGADRLSVSVFVNTESTLSERVVELGIQHTEDGWQAEHRGAIRFSWVQNGFRETLRYATYIRGHDDNRPTGFEQRCVFIWDTSDEPLLIEITGTSEGAETMRLIEKSLRRVP
jgi:hypothetical protein